MGVYNIVVYKQMIQNRQWNYLSHLYSYQNVRDSW